MTKRFFYTDPLAAAWQAKHHGMKCRVEDNDDAEYPWVDMRTVDCYFVMEEAAYYIHPDSLQLLKPQVGDLVITPGSDPAFIATERYQRFISRFSSEEAYRIVERGGVVFMWPESEDAHG